MELQGVVDETGPVHRLDRRQDRAAPEATDLPRQMGQAVSVRRGDGHLDGLPGIVEDMDVEAVPAEVRANVQHGVRGLLWCVVPTRTQSSYRRRPPFMTFSRGNFDR